MPIVIGFAFLILPLSAHTQGPDRTLIRHLAQQLTADSTVEVYGVVSDTRLPHWQLAPRPVLDTLALSLRAPIGFADSLPLPACPWDKRAEVSMRHGYRLYVQAPVIRADTGLIEVSFRCDNPPGFLHDVFGKSELFQFQRTPTGWTLLRRDLTRVT